MTSKTCYNGKAIDTNTLKLKCYEAIAGISLQLKQEAWDEAVKSAKKREKIPFAKLFVTIDPKKLFDGERSLGIRAFFFDERNEQLYFATKRLLTITKYTDEDQICVSYKLLEFMDFYQTRFSQLRPTWEHATVDKG